MKVSASSLVLVASLAIGLASPSSAHQEVAGNLKIDHPWIWRCWSGGIQHLRRGLRNKKRRG